MRLLLLLAFAALAATPASAHPRGPQVVLRGRFWTPRPVVVLSHAPICPRPAPVVVHHHRHGHRRCWRHRW